MSLSLDLESIFLLLFFIAPGFVFTRTYTAYRPRYFRQPTAFEQFVLAIVGSTVIHVGLLALVAVGVSIYWLFTGQLIHVMPLQSLTSFPVPILAAFLLISFLYLSTTLVVARRSGTTLGRRTTAERPGWWRFLLGDDPPEPFLMWHTILQIEPLELNLIPPRLNVQLRTGEFFKGDLYQMRLVGDEENTVELALRNVYFLHEPVTDVNDISKLQPLTNQTVLLKSNDILWLTRNNL
jgi:hypothetical protein